MRDTSDLHDEAMLIRRMIENNAGRPINAAIMEHHFGSGRAHNRAVWYGVSAGLLDFTSDWQVRLPE